MKPNPAGTLLQRIYQKTVTLDSDSYKVSHYRFFDPETQAFYSHFAARVGAAYNKILITGVSFHLQLLAECFITDDSFEYAKSRFESHFGDKDVFNKADFEYLKDTYGGRIPLEIYCAPEGTVIEPGNVIMTIKNTDERLAWLVGWIETRLLRCYYPIAVGTLSYNLREEFYHYLKDTGCEDIKGTLQWMLHDFGSRGVGDWVIAASGTTAHLSAGFMGTDTLAGIPFAETVYSADHNKLCGSVRATEHLVMTQEGKTVYGDVTTGEYVVVDRILNETPDEALLAMVIDSYDDERFITDVIAHFRERIEKRFRTVFRPDSGDPAETSLKVIENLAVVFGSTTNSKGYKVLPANIRVLFGDGLNPSKILKVLQHLKDNKWAAENMLFGMGSGLIWDVNRDTINAAIKGCARFIHDKWQDMFKSPKNETKGFSKSSLRGRLKLVGDHEKGYQTITSNDAEYEDADCVMQLMFRNSELFNMPTWDDVRSRTDLHFWADKPC